jgi:hypothetical protein
MLALYLITNAASSVNYFRGPQAIWQFVDLVSVRLRPVLSRRIADRAAFRDRRNASLGVGTTADAGGKHVTPRPIQRARRRGAARNLHC